MVLGFGKFTARKSPGVLHPRLYPSLNRKRSSSVPCPVCSSIYANSMTLQRHLQFHLDIPRSPCDYCTRSFQAPYQRRDHVRTVHPDQWPVYMTTTKDSLKLDPNLFINGVYTGPLPFDTEAQPPRLSPIRNLLPKPSIRGIGVPNRTSLPAMTSGLIKSRSSDIETAKPRDKLNQSLDHTSSCYDQATVGILRPYSCSLCSKSYTEDTSLFRHWKTHHIKQSPGGIDCNLCDRVFQELTSESQFLAHVRQHQERYRASLSPLVHDQSDNPSRTLVAPPHQQGTAFGKKRDKRSAQKPTLYPKAFRCKYPNCGRSFTARHSLARHAHIHTSTERVPCKPCGKTYPTHIHLQEHIRLIHSSTHAKRIMGPDVRRTMLKCLQCPMKFKRISGLQSHCRHTHPEVYQRILNVPVETLRRLTQIPADETDDSSKTGLALTPATPTKVSHSGRIHPTLIPAEAPPSEPPQPSDHEAPSVSSNGATVADMSGSDWESPSGEDNDDEYCPASARRINRKKRLPASPTPPLPIPARNNGFVQLDSYVPRIPIKVERQSDEIDRLSTLQLYLCPYPKCPRSFIDNDRLKRHLSLHKKAQKSKCGVCKRKWYSRGSRKLCPTCHHNILTQKQKEQDSFRPTRWLKLPVSCFACQSAFITEQHLKSHLRSAHTSEQSYNCKICLYIADDPVEYYAHSRAHSFDRDRSVRCSEVDSDCFQQFRNEADVDKHVQLDHSYSSETTTVEVDPLGNFNFEAQVESPLTTSNSTIVTASGVPIIVHEQPPPLIVEQSVFGIPSVLSEVPALGHRAVKKLELENQPSPRLGQTQSIVPKLRSSSLQQSATPRTSTEVENKGHGFPYPSFLCYLCYSDSSKSEDELALHIQLHRHDNLKNVCKYCDFYTYDAIRFHLHSRNHEKQLPYCCPFCYDKNGSLQDLESHISEAHGDRQRPKESPNPKSNKILLKSTNLSSADMPEL